jgi:hypothetical protein
MYVQITNDMETFKQLIDFPAYRISNKGNIQSRWKRGSYYCGFECKDEWKSLPVYYDNIDVYPTVHLCDGNGKVKTVRIHSLVAEYFIGKKPKDKQVIRHLDSDPTNNDVSNLVYGTYIENENDKIRNGTWNTRNGGAKITPDQVVEIRDKSKSVSQKDLAIEYGVSRPTITRIINNTIWKK